jgi:hypothetical protein
LATCRTAELGFFGDIVASLVTIPLACGQRLSIGVRENVGFLYFNPGLRIKRLRLVACKDVAIYTSVRQLLK